MKVIAIANRKGGVGKSTTTANLADQLTILGPGLSVLVIDLDPQGNVSSTLNPKAEAFPVSIAEIINDNGKLSLADGTYSTLNLNVDLVPADGRLKDVIERGIRRREKELIVSKLLEGAQPYDYVLMDCPPDLGLTTQNALVAADLIMAPVECCDYSIKGVGDLIYNASAMRDAQLQALPLIVFHSQWDNREKKMNERAIRQLSPLGDKYRPDLKVRQATVVKQAKAAHKLVSQYRKGHVINNDYKALARAVLERNWG